MTEQTPARGEAHGDFRLALMACAAVVALAGAAGAQEAATAAGPVAQPPSGAADVDAVVEELVVVAETREQPGAVLGDIPPEIQLGPREIRALGVSSVAELLEALAPQVGSSRGRGGGRPVTLVNGQRVSSFTEIRDLPTEAILRVDILPEEVALKYGYRADQRVVNFVLRPRFRAIAAEGAVTLPTAGGRETYEAAANALNIQRDTRLQVNVKASHATPLLESEREILTNPDTQPYDTFGNVTSSPFGAGQIDPALSAVAGRPLVVVGVPTGGLTLQDFAAAPQRTTDESPYRTLAGRQSTASLNIVYTRPLGEGTGMTVNGVLENTQGESLLGLPDYSVTVPAGTPFSPFSQPVEVQRFAGRNALGRATDTLNAHLGVTANGAVSGWRWTVTGNADRNESQSLTETGIAAGELQAAVDAGLINPFASIPSNLILYRAPDQAKSIATSADAEVLVNGQAFDLPAGRINMAFTVGAETNQLESRSIRGITGLRSYADLSRDVARAQANIDVPLTRRGQFLDAVGDLSVNVNAEVEELSDFGTLATLGGGLNWSPIDRLRFIASFTAEDGAPTMAQLGNPDITTDNVRVFDQATGQTVEVTRREGGNRDLVADRRDVFKLGMNWKPFVSQDLSFRADYTKSRTNDLISAFPSPTAEIQAAFPDRFRRENGRLVFVDVRPVNFDRRETEEIRWGFHYSRPLQATRQPQFTAEEQRRFAERRAQFEARRQGQAQEQGRGQGESTGPQGGPQREGALPVESAPRQAGSGGGDGPRFGGGGGGGGRGGGFGPGGGFRRGGGPGAGALQLAVFHTWRLQEEIFIRPGVAPLDLLDGSSIGNSGGAPRHEVEAQAGVSRNGLGARLVAKWQSGTEVNGARFGGENLNFSDLTTVNLRLFADLGLQPVAKGRPWLRGARATLSIDNLFDDRIEVRDADGLTPINYQPDLVDPIGRTVRISFRKLFF